MTVQELIVKLQTMPPDAVVMYRFASDFTDLEEEDVKFFPASARKFARHNNHIMEHRAKWDHIEPEFIDACVFPGN